MKNRHTMETVAIKKKLMCTIILDKANFMRRKISINVLLSEDNEVPSSQEYRMQNVKTIWTKQKLKEISKYRVMSEHFHWFEKWENLNCMDL